MKKSVLASLLSAAFLLYSAFGFAHHHDNSCGNETYNHQDASNAPTCPKGVKASPCPGFHTESEDHFGSEGGKDDHVSALKSNFSTSFPGGVVIGSGSNFLKLTSFTAVQNFLPVAGPVAVLPNGTLINPSHSALKNSLAGQLVTLTITIGLDNTVPGYSSSAVHIKDLLITKSPFFGWTVQNVLDEANKKIGGTSTSTISLNDFCSILTNINESYSENNGENDDDQNVLICPFQVVTTETDATCSALGNITVSNVSGAVAPYTYKWNTGATTSSLSNLSGGTYILTITDAIGLKYVISYTINQPSPITASAQLTTPIACNGGNAVITVSSLTGTGPFTGTGTYTVSAGTYTYTITDASGCTGIASITVPQPAPFVPVSSYYPIPCNGGTTSLAISATGGTAPYATPFPATVHAGTYTYHIFDSNGCTATATVVVTQPAVLSCQITATPIHCAGGLSALTVNGLGGTAPYATPYAPSVHAGTYTYRIMDSNGCPASGSVTVTEPSPLTYTPASVPPMCNKPCSGIATVLVNGGSAPYVYSWSNNLSTTDSANVCSGDTTVVYITDAQGCQASYSFAAMNCIRAMQHHLVAPDEANHYQVNNVSLFPNPASDAFEIQFSAPEISEGMLQIYDVQGREILNQSLLLTAGLNAVKLHAAEFSVSENMVFIRISFGTQVLTKKLMLARTGN